MGELKSKDTRKFYIQTYIGQGDMAIINTYPAQIIVDTGQDRNLTRKKFQQYIKTDIPTKLYLSHADEDHSGGALGIADNVQSIFVNELFKQSDLGNYFINKNGFVVSIIDKSTGIFDEIYDIDLVWPPKRCINNHNDCSIGLLFHINKTTIIMLGDLSSEIEDQIVIDIINKIPPENYKILKASHHGSKDSSSIKFLKALEPDLCIISAGKGNPYGHPSRELIDRLNSLSIPFLETSKSGDIKVIFK
jgi:competence protein ComEC